MGCGDAALNVVTGGVSGMAQGQNIGDALTGAVLTGSTGGAYDAIPDGPFKKLINASTKSLVTGTVNNIEAASKRKNFADQTDAFFDPSRTNDRWIRGSGEVIGELPLGKSMRSAAPAVMSTVGGIFGGPVGAYGGYYFGNKIKGGTDQQGMIGGAISAGGQVAGAAAGSLIAPAVGGTLASMGASPAVSSIGSGIVTGGVTGGATGAMGAAANGGDPWEGFQKGAMSGAIGGGFNAGLGQAYNAGGVSQSLRPGLSMIANQGLKYGIGELNQQVFPNQVQQQKAPVQQTKASQFTPAQQKTMQALYGGK